MKLFLWTIAIFISINFIAGFSETFVYDYFYINRYKNFNPRFYVFIYFLQALTVLFLGFYSSYILYVRLSKKHKITKYFLAMYYVLFVFILSFYNYHSPFSYISSIIYTKVVYNEAIDIRSYIKKQIITEDFKRQAHEKTHKTI